MKAVVRKVLDDSVTLFDKDGATGAMTLAEMRDRVANDQLRVRNPRPKARSKKLVKKACEKTHSKKSYLNFASCFGGTSSPSSSKEVTSGMSTKTKQDAVMKPRSDMDDEELQDAESTIVKDANVKMTTGPSAPKMKPSPTHMQFENPNDCHKLENDNQKQNEVDNNVGHPMPFQQRPPHEDKVESATSSQAKPKMIYI